MVRSNDKSEIFIEIDVSQITFSFSLALDLQISGLFMLVFDM